MVQEEVVPKTYNQLPVVDPDLELRGSGGGGRAAFPPSTIPFFFTQNKGGPGSLGPLYYGTGYNLYYL